MAAQIVSGIGFIGGGVIFMRRDAVKGLTTAASVWLTAALGMACGAGLPILAVATTVGHFVIIGTQLQAILIACTASRFSIDHLDIERGSSPVVPKRPKTWRTAKGEVSNRHRASSC